MQATSHPCTRRAGEKSRSSAKGPHPAPGYGVGTVAGTPLPAPVGLALYSPHAAHTAGRLPALDGPQHRGGAMAGGSRRVLPPRAGSSLDGSARLDRVSGRLQHLSRAGAGARRGRPGGVLSGPQGRQGLQGRPFAFAADRQAAVRDPARAAAALEATLVGGGWCRNRCGSDPGRFCARGGRVRASQLAFPIATPAQSYGAAVPRHVVELPAG